MSFTEELLSTHYDQALSLRKQGFTYRAIGAKIGVSKTQVHRWLRNFAVEKRSPMQKKITPKRVTGVHAPERSGERVPSETLEQKVRRLEQELKQARLRADFYDEMINVAEKKFQIQIRKKAGAKR